MSDDEIVLEAELHEADQEGHDDQQKGNDTTHEPVERVLSPREQLIKDMADRRREATMGAADEPTSNRREEEPPETNKTMTLKIDGEEREMPLSEIIDHGVRSLQKEIAADARLREAVEMRRSAEARAAEVQALANELMAQKERERGGALSHADAANLKEAAKEVYNKVLFGDEDEAVEALASMMGRGNTTLDGQALLNRAQEIARAEVSKAEKIRSDAMAEIAHERAVSRFKDQYKEIAEDPMLYRLADEETLLVLKEHPEWNADRDLEAILSEAGKRVLDWRNRTMAVDKRDMKRNLKSISGTSGRMPPAPEPRQKTSSEVIADQRRARGLAVY